MKLKEFSLVAALGLFCITGCDHHPKWSIVTDPNGNYGYVSWDGNVNGGFKTCEEAQAARDEKKKWSDDFEDKYKKEHSSGYWKKSDCK